MTGSDISEDILGKYCMIYINNTEQAIIYKGTPLKMASVVEGLVVKVTEKSVYVSDGSNDVVEKIVPISSIGYIDIDPNLEESGLKKMLNDVDFEDDGSRH